MIVIIASNITLSTVKTSVIIFHIRLTPRLGISEENYSLFEHHSHIRSYLTTAKFSDGGRSN